MDCLNDAIVIALGSSLPGEYASSTALLDAALAQLPGAGLTVARCSGWWRSAAWPDPSQPDYLNGVALVETGLSPGEVMARILALERRFGRRRGARNDPRTLDLDLIAHGRTIVESADLILPHPRAAERCFVMRPLAEIAPDWLHPVLGQTAAELAARCGVATDAAPASNHAPLP